MMKVNPTATHALRRSIQPLLTSLTCVWLALILIACGNASAASASSSTITTSHWQIVVTSVNHQSALYWNNHGGQQNAVGEWLLVGITLTNVGKANFGVNTWDFAVSDSASNTYKHSNDWVALTQPERMGYTSANNRQVPPGLTVSILLVFDVNPNATDLALIFNQELHPRIALPSQ
jgi:Domain of unknown function (DUF4352)